MAPERPLTLGLHGRRFPYSQLFESVARAIDSADPIGLVKGGAPRDEYSPEITDVMPRVARTHGADEIADVLHQEFSRMFGEPTAGGRERYQALAAEIWRAVSEFQTKMALVVVDVSAVPDAGSLHALLSEALGFPGYYGMNWDAFNDCVGEWDSAPLPETLRIVGWARLAERIPREATLFRQCLQALEPRHTGCRVEWVG